MFKRNLLILGFATAVVCCQAYAGAVEARLKKVHVNKAAQLDEVLGIQTYYGRIVSAFKIKDEARRNFSNLPKVNEILSDNEIELKNGESIPADHLQYLYVRRLEDKLATASPEGREPSTDED